MIAIKNVSKKYFRETVVSGISLAVRDGTVFGFLGQNGSGKTTTMKMIVGITAPSAGTIEIDGESTGDISIHEKIGYMPEAPYFYDRLTGIEFLRFSGELFRDVTQSDTQYENLLKKVGIYDARNKAIWTYSKGMKQRLGFAQALVNNPKYIFLDEPLDGLDPIGRLEIKKLIFDLKNDGKTIFFNSHILSDVENICDQIGIINKGKLIYAGPVNAFRKDKSLEEQFVHIIKSITD